jgi:hypothetical protein
MLVAFAARVDPAEKPLPPNRKHKQPKRRRKGKNSPNEMLSERNALKRSSNGRRNNSATNSCQSKKSLPRKRLNQKGRGRSSLEAGARVPRGHTGEEAGSGLRPNWRLSGFS